MFGHVLKTRQGYWPRYSLHHKLACVSVGSASSVVRNRPHSHGSVAAAASSVPTAAPRVAVVGGGIAGPALALLLQARLPAAEVAVFEAEDDVREVGAGISIAPNGMRVLDELGLASKLADTVGERITIMKFGRPDGSAVVEFPNRAQVLLDELRARGVQLRLGKRLSAIKQPELGAATLVFEDGSDVEADLVVGCDGLRSRVRRALFGEQELRFTGDQVVFAVSAARHEDLVPRGQCAMVYGPGHHHFGAYGLADDCVSWFTVTRAAQAIESWGTLSAEDRGAAAAALRQEFAGWQLAQRLLACDTSVMIRLGIYDRDPAPTWTRGVVTLVGDAANPIPANLGQGGSKALEDAAVLSLCVSRELAAPPSLPGSLHTALQRAALLYEEVRRPRVAELLSYSRTASTMSSLNNPVACAARNLAVRAAVAFNGGVLPQGWMWDYDPAAAVAEHCAKAAATAA